MTLYGTLTEPPSAEDARALFAAFTARLDRRLAWFRDEVAAAGGPATDGSPASLDPLLDHVVGRVHEAGPEPEPPDWFVPRRAELGWTDRGAALVEGLAAYVAALMTGTTGAGWELDEDPRSAFARQPVLTNRMAPPWHLVIQAVRRVAADPAAKKLERAVRANLAAAPREQPPARDEPLDVEVTAVSHPEWDLQASIPEWAEDALGRAVFDSLVERFRAVDGVRDALHEDREVFLLRTAGVTPETLRARLQSVLDAART